MRKKFSGRGGMLLAFLVGCVVATAATAGAATLITGKQIKNGTITSKDLSKALRKQIAKAGTAGAAGAVGATGATGAKGDPGTAGAKGDKGDKGDPGTPATRLFAHVKSDGALNYGSGATTVSHPSTGQYTVNFNRSLANCASVITPGWGNPTGSDFNAGPLDAWQWETGNSVQVYLYNNAGTATNSSFHIAVFC